MRIENIYGAKRYEDMYITKENPAQDRDVSNTKRPQDPSYEDGVSISDDARSILSIMKNIEGLDKNDTTGNDEDYLLKLMEDIKNKAMEKSDSSDPLLKCIIIAMRIMKGHKVPLKDEKFLAEKEPEMYLRAVLLRQKNDDPKKYKTLLKEEKKNPLDRVEVLPDPPIEEVIGGGDTE